MDWLLSEVYEKHYSHKMYTARPSGTKTNAVLMMPGIIHFISLDLRILNKVLTEVSLYILKVIWFAISRSLDRLGETHTFNKRTSINFTSKKKCTSVTYL